MNSELVASIIQASRWFAFAPPEAQEWIVNRAKLKEFGAGQMLWFRGQPMTHVYCVVEGVIRTIITTAKGDEYTIQELSPGQWLPHHVPEGRPIYLGDCVSETDAAVISVPYSTFAECGTLWPSLYRGLYQELTDNISASLGRLVLLYSHNLSTRLAVHLLRLLKEYGQMDTDGVETITMNFKQNQLAAHVGATRQRVNIILNDWAREGLISLHRQGIRVYQIEALRTEAEKSGFSLAEFYRAFGASNHN